MLINRDQLEASIVRESFKDFVQRFWDTIVPEKLVWNWHMDVLCQYLQEAAERVFKGEPKKEDIIINIPPGTTKSSVCSIFYLPWIWTRMPTARSINASYSYPLAMDLSRKSRDVVTSEKYTRLFGDVGVREDQNAKGYFATEAGGMRYAVGTGGSVMGFHGHFLVVDDPLDPNQAVSEAKLEAANRWIAETLPSRKVNKEVTVTILIMQRLHQNDPSAVMLRRADEGVATRHIKLPAEIQGSGFEQVRPRRLAKFYKEGLLDPQRLPRRVLSEALASLGQYGYAGQMLQEPVPLGGGMFKPDRIQIDVPPPRADLIKEVRYWDKAGTAGGGAFTAGILMSRDSRGRFWILDDVRGQWDASVRERIIKQTAALDTRKVSIWVEQEPGSGGKESAQGTVRNLAGYNVHVERPTGHKELRADPFSVQVNGDNVFMRAGPWNKAFLEELEYFPHSRYKDQVDAASGAFAALVRPIKVGGFGRRGK